MLQLSVRFDTFIECVMNDDVGKRKDTEDHVEILKDSSRVVLIKNTPSLIRESLGNVTKAPHVEEDDTRTG